MDGFPSGSLDHNVPLLLVSGLSTGSTKPLLTDPTLKEQSILIRSELAPVDNREAKSILRYIRETDASDLPWNSWDISRKYKFKVKPIGREFVLPPRRARLPEDFDAPLSPPVLHSPFSPLSPGSTLYPDGLIDTRWLQKHQSFIPSVCLCFYSLTTDPTLATLHDSQLKTDINAVKNALIQSGYKCRLAVVLLCDQSPSAMTVYQERLENILRSTGLDPKASLFVVPTRRSDPELETAIDNVLSAIFVQATEYYRDIGRHARKKKGRGIAPQPTIPPTTGTSYTLSLQGWNVRYDFKTAVFAEFRQEMDVALRSYEQAYETLFGTDVLETIPSWSPRFNDGRLLADMLAVRILRCLLWTGQSTAAVRRWQAHRYRMADFLDRRGRGTQNYGWQAWEARWAEIMATLIEKVNYAELEPSTLSLFRTPEKTLSAERLQPWELLHHPGYWYRTAARHALDRRKLALEIPESDRQPPNPSARSASVVQAYNAYDTYLCPEPYEEYPSEGRGTRHTQQALRYWALAKAEFQKRQQNRIVAEMAVECSKELEQIMAWKEILELLTPIWRDMSFRTEGWWDITEVLSWTLRNAAAKAGQADLIVAIDWELVNRSFTRRPNWHYDIKKSLHDVEVDQPPDVTINDTHMASFLSSSFIFKPEEGRAGQTCPAQLAITSCAFAGSQPIILDEIRVEFEGGLRTFYLKHRADSSVSSATTQMTIVTPVSLTGTEVDTEVEAEEGSESSSEAAAQVALQGVDDLTIYPGQTRVFHMNLLLREAGDARASSVRVTVAPEAFTLRYTMEIRDNNAVGVWYTPAGRERVTRVDPQHIKVLPRPPNMEIKFIDAHSQYYAGEPIQINVEIINKEELDAKTRLDVHLYGQDVPVFKVQVADEEQSSTGEGEEARVNGISAGSIATSKSTKATITIESINRPTACDLTIKAWYNLVSDPGASIVQIGAFQLNIVSPFEASYDLVPRLHSEVWPSIFDPEGITDLSDQSHNHSPQGLAQKWCLITRFGSFATEDITVQDLEVKVLKTHGSVHCTAFKNQTLPPRGLTIAPNTMEEAHFDLIAHKFSVDDRAPATADLAFIIKWQRTNSPTSIPNTTTFNIDPFYVTVSEPRVLAGVSYSSAASPSHSLSPTSQSFPAPPLVILDITIENPSSHFLTFGLTMEPSEEFAFSGAKTITLNVLPIARRSITYRLLPLVKGAWIWPKLIVRDKYFQKVLKIIPTEGMKREGETVAIWVPGNDAEAQAGGQKDGGDDEGPVD